MQMNEVGLLLHIIYKNELHIDINVRAKTVTLLEEKNLCDLRLGKRFLTYDIKSWIYKEGKRSIGLYQN